MEPWRRNNLAATLAVFLLTAGFSFTIPFLPLYLQKIAGISGPHAALWAGVATVLGGVGSFFSGPLWGVLGDRYGRKPMLVRAAFGGALGLLALGAATAIWQVVAIRFWIGVMAGAPAAALALMASGTPTDRLPRAIGTFQSASLLGLALGPGVAASLIGALGYRLTFYVTSAVMFAGAVATVVLIREDRAKVRAEWEVNRSSSGHMFATLVQVLSLRQARIMFAIVLGIGFGVPMIQTTLAPFIATLVSSGDVKTAVALMYTGISVFGAVAATIVGRLLRRTGAARILIGCSLAAGVMLLPQGASHTLWELAPLVMAMSFFQGGIQTSTAGLVASIVSQSAVSAGFGVYQSVQAASAQVAPAIGGLVASSFGFRSVFPAAGAVLIAAGFVAARYLPKAVAAAQAPNVAAAVVAD